MEHSGFSENVAFLLLSWSIYLVVPAMDAVKLLDTGEHKCLNSLCTQGVYCPALWMSLQLFYDWFVFIVKVEQEVAEEDLTILSHNAPKSSQ